MALLRREIIAFRCATADDADNPCLVPSPSAIPLQESPDGHHRSRVLPICVSVIVFSVILFSYYVIFRCYAPRRRRHRAARPRAQPPAAAAAEEPPADDEPYHVWLIRTKGLDEEEIGAIAVISFRRGEGAVDGGDCSICLGEFRDGDRLRVLPKCSHAFHVACIEPWLRSRVNCPVCRAPILAPPAPAAGPRLEPRSAPAGPSSSVRIEVAEEQDEARGTETTEGAKEEIAPDMVRSSSVNHAACFLSHV
ncbi:uncharacterized protein LOC144713932 [Wolffia australiana]